MTRPWAPGAETADYIDDEDVNLIRVYRLEDGSYDTDDGEDWPWQVDYVHVNEAGEVTGMTYEVTNFAKWADALAYAVAERQARGIS